MEENQNLLLTPQLIDEAIKWIEPEKIYEPADECTAQHIMYQEFIEKTKWKGVPKLVYYIVMNKTYGLCSEKDPDGRLGRKLKLKPQTS